MIGKIDFPLTYGTHVICSANVPKTPTIKTAEDCPCTPKFRASHDAWLLGRFGEKDQALMYQGQLIVSPEVERLLRESK